MASYHIDFINRFTTYDHPKRQLAWVLASVALVMLLASIGATDFNTKGEPREAVVAHAMLTQGNWILPVDSAGDMAYKPPMFHWLIAAFSWALGSLSEFSCRLPSALALVALVTMTFYFFAPRSKDGANCKPAILTALFTLTAFECFRAGTNCRVDMVLTAFMCGAMMAMCKALVKGSFGLYFVGALCMSGAALTKGPVGILLPLAVFWIFGLLRGRNFFYVSVISLLLLVGAAILPAVYYYSAWQIGGEKFYQLAYEENIGRMFGHMSYESHVKPWWYNIVTLVLGWLPWTLFVIVTGVWAWTRRKRNLGETKPETRKSFRQRMREMPAERLFSIVAIVVILLFYTVPKSKRSVYLLPMYPFIAYWLTIYVKWLMDRFGMRRGAISWSMLAVCFLYPVAYGLVYPAIVNGKSDRVIAKEFNRLVPEGDHLYTFIPDRFLRYYVTDHYMGYRMRPLLPSGQTSGSDQVPDANDIMMPSDSTFFVALSTDVWNGKREALGRESYDKGSDYGFHDWISVNRFEVDSLYTSENKTHDVRGKLVLLKIRK